MAAGVEMHEKIAWVPTTISCGGFLIPVALATIRDTRACIMVMLSSLACTIAGVAFHACQNDAWCNINFIHHHSAVEYMDVYTTRLLFISIFMRVCQAFSVCGREVGFCGAYVIIRSGAWSALKALIIMTTVATDELPGEMDYHVFLALSAAIVMAILFVPNATRRANTAFVLATFGMFLIGTLFFFEAERHADIYDTFHSIWHLFFSASAICSLYAIRTAGKSHPTTEAPSATMSNDALNSV